MGSSSRGNFVMKTMSLQQQRNLKFPEDYSERRPSCFKNVCYFVLQCTCIKKPAQSYTFKSVLSLEKYVRNLR